MNEVECQDCGWTGMPDELVAVGDDSWDFVHCPNCEGTNIEDWD